MISIPSHLLRSLNSPQLNCNNTPLPPVELWTTTVLITWFLNAVCRSLFGFQNGQSQDAVGRLQNDQCKRCRIIKIHDWNLFHLVHFVWKLPSCSFFDHVLTHFSLLLLRLQDWIPIHWTDAWPKIWRCFQNSNGYVTISLWMSSLSLSHLASINVLTCHGQTW